MQLKAGKKYTDRRGRVYGPLVAACDFFGETDGDYAWYESGRRSPGRIIEGDLVAEYVEPAPVEPQDDWVEITDPKHVMRRNVDYVYYCDQWNEVLGYAGYVVEEAGMVVRCRRKDLPPVKPVIDPGEGYRMLEPHEVTLPDDERIYVWAADDRSAWETLAQCNLREFVGVTVESLLTSRPDIFIRRKLPAKTRTITLKEYVCWDNDTPKAVCVNWQTDGMVRHINFHHFDNEYFTGNERTIEIPL